MAQKTVVTVTCDFPHKAKEGEVGGAETLTWSFEGTAYEADACEDHALAIRAQFKELSEHARRPTGQRQPGTRRRRTTAGRERSSAIRAWAKQHGHQVSERGRIPMTVQHAYDAAH
jgi:nucleoid-associated protein Lsr2